MFADLLSTPGAGGLVAAGAFYAGMSLLVTGPLVGERMIERLDWTADCERSLAAPTVQSSQDTIGGECHILLGSLFGRDAVDFCRRNSRELESWSNLAKRLVRAPRVAPPRSTCACAVREVLDSRRTEFALHAGSLRLITPRPVRELRGELNGALSSSACQRRP